MEGPTNYRKINPLSKIEYSKMNLIQTSYL